MTIQIKTIKVSGKKEEMQRIKKTYFSDMKQKNKKEKKKNLTVNFLGLILMKKISIFLKP